MPFRALKTAAAQQSMIKNKRRRPVTLEGDRPASFVCGAGSLAAACLVACYLAAESSSARTVLVAVTRLRRDSSVSA